MSVLFLVLLVLVLANATLNLNIIPRQVLITKFVKNVGPTNPAAFIDAGRARLKSWGVLTSSQLTALDTTDRLFFYNKTGINVSTGMEYPVGSGIFIGPTWSYFPAELQSTDRLDWVVSDSYKPFRTGPLRLVNWITANGGNTLAFTANGLFPGGQWQGLPYYQGGVIASEYVIMVPNITKSLWKNNYELHYCRTELEPAVAALNVYRQANTIVAKSCTGVTEQGKSTVLVTNIYTNTSATTRDSRKTHAWTWSW
ncbi:Hypothetical protein POVR2_LOCUS63 [uncultured virus]|nr:Hypothetical protein POVR2_LOCUS63 [uncultured virus]